MTTFTTLNEIAAGFNNENIANLFMQSFISSTVAFMKIGLTQEQANEAAFDFLIMNKGFEKLSSAYTEEFK